MIRTLTPTGIVHICWLFNHRAITRQRSDDNGYESSQTPDGQLYGHVVGCWRLGEGDGVFNARVPC